MLVASPVPARKKPRRPGRCMQKYAKREGHLLLVAARVGQDLVQLW